MLSCEGDGSVSNLYISLLTIYLMMLISQNNTVLKDIIIG
jgi:hypothetical protein